MSKGSKQRPGEGYQESFSRIFGEKKREAWVPPALPKPVDPEAAAFAAGMASLDRMLERYESRRLSGSTETESPYIEMLKRKGQLIDRPQQVEQDKVFFNHLKTCGDSTGSD